MGNIAIVHGIIKLEDLAVYKNVVKAMEADENYPWVRSEMFNLCAKQPPYYYKNPIATFGATYKNLDGGVALSVFILKFEHLLSIIEFDFARIRLETEIMGDYEFFWGAKKDATDKFYARHDLVETDHWFFGYGKRHMFGELEESVPKLPPDFQYPITFHHPTKEAFNAILPELNRLELGEKVFFDNWSNHKVFGDPHTNLILTYLKINKVLQFGWEPEKGFFLTRLGEIKKL